MVFTSIADGHNCCESVPNNTSSNARYPHKGNYCTQDISTRLTCDEQVLRVAADDPNVDVHDRALFYARLLKADPRLVLLNITAHHTTHLHVAIG